MCQINSPDALQENSVAERNNKNNPQVRKCAQYKFMYMYDDVIKPGQGSHKH